MDDEIYSRFVEYHELISQGWTEIEAATIIEEGIGDKIKQYGAMGLAGLASLTATPSQSDAASPTEIRQDTKHEYGTIMGHKVHYAGPAVDRGQNIQMVVVAARGKSQRDISIASLAAKSGIGQMITGKKNYKTNVSGIFISYKNVKGYGFCVIAKYNPEAGKQMRDTMRQDLKGSEGGSGVSGKYQGGAVGNRPSPDDIDDF